MTEMVFTVITAGLLLTGALLMLIAALGLVRMPDLLTRMHATTKAGALGSGLMVLAVAVHFGQTDIVARAVAVVIFIILTAPVAAHAIGRASYFVGVPLWEGTVKDELKNRYDARQHTLRSEAEPPPDKRVP
jgi:multicomponent Na+:H+ antiporter subunit G